MRSTVFLSFALLTLVACGDDDTGGGVDTGTASDSGTSDTGSATDSGTGETDSGTASDTGGATDAGSDTSTCEPMCDGRACGDDGCGGSCGDCGEGQVCTPAGACEVASATSCPPTGPFGNTVSDVVADGTAFDCDGNPVTLHSLCENEVSWVLTFSEWCPNCRNFASSGRLNAIVDDYADADVDGFLLVAQQSSGSIADAATCARVRDRYGLRVNVLFDRDRIYSSALAIAPNSGAAVLERGGEIVWKGGHSGLSAEIGRRLE